MITKVAAIAFAIILLLAHRSDGSIPNQPTVTPPTALPRSTTQNTTSAAATTTTISNTQMSNTVFTNTTTTSLPILHPHNGSSSNNNTSGDTPGIGAATTTSPNHTVSTSPEIASTINSSYANVTINNTNSMTTGKPQISTLPDNTTVISTNTTATPIPVVTKNGSNFTTANLKPIVTSDPLATSNRSTSIANASTASVDTGQGYNEVTVAPSRLNKGAIAAAVIVSLLVVVVLLCLIRRYKRRPKFLGGDPMSQSPFYNPIRFEEGNVTGL